MNLAHYSEHHPIEPFSPESEASFYSISLSMMCKETSDSEKNTSKFWNF